MVRSAAPVVKVLVVNNDINLEYFLPGNSVTTKFTTPDLVNAKTPFGRIKFGVDRAADPHIRATFDLTLRATITPQLHGAPQIKTASVSVQNSKLIPVNLSAKVLSAINDFVDWVGGPNFRGLAEQAINAQGIRVNDPLTNTLRSLDARIAPLTSNAKSLSVRLEGSLVNVVYMAADPYVPVLH